MLRRVGPTVVTFIEIKGNLRFNSRHVGKLEFSMQRHTLIHKKPTYPNILDVEKNPNATSKRAANQTLTA